MGVEVKKRLTIIFFKTIPTWNAIPELVKFSDASFNELQATAYGKTGTIPGIRYQKSGCDSQTFHLFNWAIDIQKRVCYSSYEAGILAYTTADDGGFAFKQRIESMFPIERCIQIVQVDSKGIFDPIAILYNRPEYRLQPTDQRIGDSF